MLPCKFSLDQLWIPNLNTLHAAKGKQMLLLSIKSSLTSPVVGGPAMSMDLVMGQGVRVDLRPGRGLCWNHSLATQPVSHSGWQTDELLAIESLYLFEGYRHHISYSRSAPMLPGFRHFTLQLCTLDLGFCNSYFRVTQKCQRCFHVDIAGESSGVWPANMISETAAGLDQLQHIRQGGPEPRSQFLALITWAWLPRISTKFSGTTAHGVHAQWRPGSGSAVANTVTVKFGSGTSGYMGSTIWQAKHMHLPFGEPFMNWRLLLRPGDSSWFGQAHLGFLGTPEGTAELWSI